MFRPNSKPEARSKWRYVSRILSVSGDTGPDPFWPCRQSCTTGKAMNETYLANNEASLTRLRALVERLTDDDLRREMRDGWTVAALLAHLAFYDRMRLEGWL